MNWPMRRAIATLAHFRADGSGRRQQGSHALRPGDRGRPAVAKQRDARDAGARRARRTAILGEEFGPKPGTSGLTWVLDPIDGTRGYLSGTPTWGVLIAVARWRRARSIGIIDQPYHRRTLRGRLRPGRGQRADGAAAAEARAARGRWPRRSCSPPSPRSARPRKAPPSAGWRAQARLIRYGHGLLCLCADRGGADRSGGRGRACRPMTCRRRSR